MSAQRRNTAAVWPTHRARARERRRTSLEGPVRLNTGLRPLNLNGFEQESDEEELR